MGNLTSEKSYPDYSKLEKIEIPSRFSPSSVALLRRIVIASFCALFLYVMAPFLQPIAMGAVLAIAFYPLFERMKKTSLPTWLDAGVVTLGLTFACVLPMTVLVILAAENALEAMEMFQFESGAMGPIEGMVQILENKLPRLTQTLDRFLPLSTGEIAAALKSVSTKITVESSKELAQIVALAPRFLFSIFIVIASLYNFLLKGEAIHQYLKRVSCFDIVKTERFIILVKTVCRSVLLAAVLSGVVQSVIMASVCYFAGIQRIALLSLLVFAWSFVPWIGTAPVTFGVAVHQFSQGRSTVGFVMVATGVVLTITDNLIRPLVLQGRAKMNMLLAFVAAFGGLKMIGFYGLFLGPVVAQITFSFLSEIGRQSPTLTTPNLENIGERCNVRQL